MNKSNLGWETCLCLRNCCLLHSIKYFNIQSNFFTTHKNLIIICIIHRLHTVILLVESALFGLFVLAIMIDQMCSILHDETAVEAVQQKGTYRPHRRKFTLLADVFGRGHPFCWLVPCSTFQSNARKYDTPLLSHDV